jgi:hypothetical protein
MNALDLNDEIVASSDEVMFSVAIDETELMV